MPSSLRKQIYKQYLVVFQKITLSPVTDRHFKQLPKRQKTIAAAPPEAAFVTDFSDYTKKGGGALSQSIF
jgi:hypothetical protein